MTMFPYTRFIDLSFKKIVVFSRIQLSPFIYLSRKQFENCNAVAENDISHLKKRILMLLSHYTSTHVVVFFSKFK